MAEALRTHSTGNYIYLPGPPTFSLAVMAQPGYRIHRARFRTPRLLSDALPEMERHLASLGRSVTSLVAMELRSRVLDDPDAFATFNREYGSALQDWGLTAEGGLTPTRSNVGPETAEAGPPHVWSFAYTVAGEGDRPNFVISGAAETRPGTGALRDRVVAYGDLSDEGLQLKCNRVLDELESRMAALDVSWQSTSIVQVYTVANLHPLMAEIARRGADRNGLLLHSLRPPIRGLDLEMDCQAVWANHLI